MSTPQASKSHPIVGRAQELALLTSLLKRAKGGAGSTLFVSGEGGVGKTRLLAEASDIASRSGWSVALGRGYPVETGVPYALFSDAFLALLQEIEPPTLSVLTRGGTAELSLLFPALTVQGSRERLLTGVDPAELKARLLWNFTQLLGKLSARQPLCIVLENLQWADASSLELLHFAARQICAWPIVIFASYNETERDANPVLRTTEHSLVNLGVAQTIGLGPLTQPQVLELLQSKFGGDSQEMTQFSALLYGWTRGNPFFIDETLKLLVESGALRQSGDEWTGWQVDSFRLPATVRDSVSARIDGLGRDAREAADLGAVLGTQMKFDQLKALTGLDDMRIAGALDELCDRHILDEINTTGGTVYDFAHPMVQQVLYGLLGAGRSRLLHAKVAEALETYYGDASMSHAGELAFHFARSSVSGLKAVRYLSHAGQAALLTYANSEAATFLSSALQQTEALQDAIAGRDTIVRNLARAKQRLGHYDEALALWDSALGAARQTGDLELVSNIEYRMGLACHWSGKFDDALCHYEQGLASAGDNPAVVVRLHLAKAMCLQELGRVDAAKAVVLHALGAAENSGDSSLLARAHRALLLLHIWTGPRDVALHHGKKAIHYAELSGDRMLQWTAHWALGILAGLTSNAADTMLHIRACKEIEEQLRSPLLPLWTAELSILYDSWTGNWNEALQAGERAIARARSLRQRTLLPRLLVWTALVYLWRNDLKRASAYFEESWRMSGAETASESRVDVQTVVPAHMGKAAYHLATGNYAEAIRVGEAGAALADKLGYVAWTVHWLLPVVGEAAIWLRDFERAEKCSVRIRRDSDRLSSPIGEALADACDGMLSLLRDENFKEAIRLLRSAVEKLDAIPLPDHAARVRRALSQALRDSGDRDGALAELRSAHDTFAELGAASELDYVRGEIRKLGVRPPSKSAPKGIGSLTGRELEIAQMVALRKTNKQIGAALDISSRTVSTHLTNIFTKTGVASRAELGDYFRDEIGVS